MGNAKQQSTQPIAAAAERTVRPMGKEQSEPQSRSSVRRLLVIATISLFALSIAKDLYLLRMIPQNYDEAYFLDVVQAIREAATTPRVTPLFNPQVTTGATVTMPMVWFTEFFSFSVARARMIVFFYQLAAIALLATLVYRVCASATLALLCGASLFAVPFFRDFGTTVLGEVPAFAFLLAATFVLYTLRERIADARLLISTLPRCAIAGLCFGLSVLTKTQMLVLLPGFLIELAWLSLHSYRMQRGSVRLRDAMLSLALQYFVFFSCAAVPMLVFFASMLKIKGIQGTADYYSYLAVFSGHTSVHDAATALAHLRLLASWIWQPLCAWLLVLALCPRALGGFFKSPFRLLHMCWLGWFVWWCGLSATSWGRHLFPGLLIFYTAVFSQLACALYLAVRERVQLSRSFPRLTIATLIFAAPSVVQFGAFLGFNPNTVDYSNSLPGEPFDLHAPVGSYAEWRDAELAAAAYAQSIPNDYRICSTGFMRDFKIEARLGKRFCTLDLSEITPESGPTVVVFNKFEKAYFPSEHVAERSAAHAQNATASVDVMGYTFYFYNAEAPPKAIVTSSLGVPNGATHN